MRIAFIVDAFPDISGTFILNQVTGLIDRGHVVDIYAPQGKILPLQHPVVGERGLLSNTYYHPTMPQERPDEPIPS